MPPASPTVHATVWFDGACRFNPGPMGAGAVVEMADGRRKVLSRSMGLGTNNVAEYHGLILGLRHALGLGATAVTVHGDSQLVIKQLQGLYKVRAPQLKALHEEARGLLAQLRPAVLEWVPRAENAEADAASWEAANRPPDRPVP